MATGVATAKNIRALFDGDSTVKAVAKRMDIDWRTVKDAEVRYIRGLLRKRNLNGIKGSTLSKCPTRRAQVPDAGHGP